MIRRASVGIDLGTTYSLCSVADGSGSVKILAINNSRMLPSVVAVLPHGGMQTTEVHNPNHRHTFSSMKRVIGRKVSEVAKMKELYFRNRLALSQDQQELAAFTTGISALPIVMPEQIAACIIKTLSGAAEAQLNKDRQQETKIENAVITVPAYFNNAQRQATERAGHLAGLKKVKLLKEPEAAALAYGLDLRVPQIVLVFDLGGGTLDVSVVEVGDGFVEVIATAGDPYLGGDDFDLLLADWLWGQYTERYGGSQSAAARRDPAMQRIVLSLARDLKETLSSQAEATATLPAPSGSRSDSTAPETVTLTRRAMEAMCKPLLTRMLQPLRQAAVVAGVNLQGDSARLGTVEYHSGDTNGDEEAGQSYEAGKERQRAGRAAARLRQAVQGRSAKELERLRKQLAPALKGGGGGGLQMFPSGRSVDALLLVGGATRMLCVRNAIQTVTGLTALAKDKVHPDEAVCLGAGTMAGMLDGIIPDMRVVSHWQSAMLRFLKEEKDKGNDLYGTSRAVVH